MPVHLLLTLICDSKRSTQTLSQPFVDVGRVAGFVTHLRAHPAGAEPRAVCLLIWLSHSTQRPLHGLWRPLVSPLCTKGCLVYLWCALRRKHVCWWSSIQAWAVSRVLGLESSVNGSTVYVKYGVFNKNTHRTRLGIDWLVYTLYPEAHRNLVLYFP